MHVLFLFAYNKNKRSCIGGEYMHRELQRFFAGNQLVEIIYLDRHGKTSKRRLRIQAIQGGRIKAYCFTRRALRVFAIENILAVAPVRERALG